MGNRFDMGEGNVLSCQRSALLFKGIIQEAVRNSTVTNRNEDGLDNEVGAGGVQVSIYEGLRRDSERNATGGCRIRISSNSRFRFPNCYATAPEINSLL